MRLQALVLSPSLWDRISIDARYENVKKTFPKLIERLKTKIILSYRFFNHKKMLPFVEGVIDGFEPQLTASDVDCYDFV